MKTKKALIIYTGLIAAIAMILISTFIGASKQVNAAGWDVTQSSCSGSVCRCPEWATGACPLHRHVCYGDQDGGICMDNPSQVGLLQPGQSVDVMNFLGGIDCATVQFDVNREGDPSWSGYYGGVILVWNDWSVCGGDDGGGDDGGGGDNGGGGCPYASTQARVHTSVSEPWTENLTLDACSAPVIVGSFHNHDANFANDTDIQVVGPQVNVGLPNEGTFTAISGEYTVYVRTRISGTSDYYSEDACNATARVVCPADNGGEPDFEITKVATNDDGPYEIGEIVRFRVQIQNTGDETLSSIAYRDVFDNRYLTFLSVIGVSPDNPSGVNMTNHFTITENGNITTVASDDITAQLGDLEPGEILYFNYEFRATNPSNRACNDVFAQPEGLSEEQARDCVGITISTDL